MSRAKGSKYFFEDLESLMKQGPQARRRLKISENLS